MVLIVLVVGAIGYFMGSINKKSQIMNDQSGASVYTSEVIANDWWPAGNGFCYHKIRGQWGSYWVLGEISGIKCVNIAIKEHADNLEGLIKSGKLSPSVTLKK